MALDSKENHEEIKNEIQKERRSFLKKTAYTAPTLMIMGQLARPTSSSAGFGNPPDDPSGQISAG